MLKKLWLLCLLFGLSMGVAFAAVEVNSADQAALESVKGLGPVKSKAIIDERSKNGPFKSADDLADRVKGLGVKSVSKLEAAGLTIGGSSAPPTGVKPSSRSASTTTAPAPRSKPAPTTATAPTTAPAPSAPAPTATPGSAPAATPEAASGAKTKKLSKRAQARADAASAASGASSTSAKKPRGKKGSKAASDAAAT